MFQLRLHHTISVILGITLLSACTPAYVTPPDGATSTLTYPQAFISLRTMSSIDTIKIGEKGNDRCAALQALPKSADDKEPSVKIHGGTDHIMFMGGSIGGATCLVVFSFHAEENAAYHARFKFLDRVCKGVVTQQTANGEAVVLLKKAKLVPLSHNACEQ